MRFQKQMEHWGKLLSQWKYCCRLWKPLSEERKRLRREQGRAECLCPDCLGPNVEWYLGVAQIPDPRGSVRQGWTHCTYMARERLWRDISSWVLSTILYHLGGETWGACDFTSHSAALKSQIGLSRGRTHRSKDWPRRAQGDSYLKSWKRFFWRQKSKLKSSTLTWDLCVTGHVPQSLDLSTLWVDYSQRLGCEVRLCLGKEVGQSQIKKTAPMHTSRWLRERKKQGPLVNLTNGLEKSWSPRQWLKGGIVCIKSPVFLSLYFYPPLPCPGLKSKTK